MTQLLTAKQFNELSAKNNWKWVKLTKENERHNGFQFKTGLNVDTKEFEAEVDCNNGLFFCRDTDMGRWALGHTFIRDVTIPDDSPHTIVVNNSRHKAKVHALVLGEKRDLWTDDNCRTMVKEDGYELYCLPFAKRTHELCLFAVQRNGHALKDVPPEKLTHELCSLAVHQNGLALCYVPREKQTREMCMVAVQQNGQALSYVQLAKRTDDICRVAVQQHGFALEYVPDEKQTDEMYKLAVQQNWRVLRLIPLEKRTLEIQEMAAAHRRSAAHQPLNYHVLCTFRDGNAYTHTI